MAGLNFSKAVFFLLSLALAIASSSHRRQSSLSLPTSSFGISLYKRLISGNQGNIIFSPISVYTALSMTLLGAGGSTKRELRRSLKIQHGQNIHSNIQNLLASMTTEDPVSNLTLRLANALYYDAAQVTISNGYAARMRRYYGVEPRPFQRPNPEQAINTWVEEVTEDAITDLLSPGDIQPDDVLMLLNAVFFEASWMTLFQPSFTRTADFTTISGVVKPVTMMGNDNHFSVKNVPELDARVLELPYKGGNYSLFIILPNNQNGLTEMESKFTGQILENAVTSMPRAMNHMVFVPKFSLRMRSELKEPLQALGLRAMFEPSDANFTAMTTNEDNLFVSKILQEALIEVTESGTKAAAVTAVFISIRSMPPEFRANHAFTFVLRDKINRVNLFVGRLADPSQDDQ